jgi:hypothetical protein
MQQQEGSVDGANAAAAAAGTGTPSAAGGKAVGFASAFSGHEASRRRSIGGNMRYVRFQFRSISSAASHMMPHVSIPPALLSQDTNSNFYWATVDIPSATSTHGGEEASSFVSGSNLYFIGGNVGPAGVFGGAEGVWTGSMQASDSAAPSTHSSGLQTGPGSDSSSMQQQQLGGMKTTFSLMPEDNPFQDITIGSLLGWGSYGRVHRGECGAAFFSYICWPLLGIMAGTLLSLQGLQILGVLATALCIFWPPT